MKKIKNDLIPFLHYDLKSAQSLVSFNKLLNKEYISGEIHKNIILNTNQKSSFLYFEVGKNEVILGFKNTNHELYQKLLQIKDRKIFEINEQHKDNQEEDIADMIKDIKNYSYIQGGAIITFNKKLLKDYIQLKLKTFKELPNE
ncbi:conserved Plasmodium protein, unknown function [Plasmodium sp. gorilla clade G2]|uniref:conserved Plasmodium protein, unknown function n=1 Tax=Plasmodium sp. gorilla clade G2 TaxID=880535 RepID=UPI000D22CC58|nr:conserved Plasmodium protein, unknown function [Plasmodium sp. gorilla clade G2]SOV17134.1 conserved Plasmodium protein, unknown function [Plasmodium sp. gorilla clade G2]